MKAMDLLFVEDDHLLLHHSNLFRYRIRNSLVFTK